MPARIDALMPSVACEWAITKMPAAVASATRTSSSSSRKCPCLGLSRGDSTPPEVATLMTSAPALTISRTFLRISSGPSTRPLGLPGCGMPNGVGNPPPHTIHLSPWPPVWLNIPIEICMRGPFTIPRSTAVLTPRSAPPASRTVVIPVASVASRFSLASKNCSENGV